MSSEKISRHSGIWRLAIFAFALLVHVAAICLFSVKQKEDEIETVDFSQADVFKLVDVQEYVQPKEPQSEEIVVQQPKASERVLETEKKVKDFDESAFLPQHKISTVPVIPIREVLSKIEYPPMALRQGIEAVVYLELFIDSKGAIKNIKVLKDPGHGFAEAAVAALKGIVCVPANANGKNVATVNDSLSITVSHSGKTVVTIKARQAHAGNIKKLAGTKHMTETIQAPFYRHNKIWTEGNQMDLTLNDGFGLQVRACNEGVAYRFYTTNKKVTIIKDEMADFVFPHDSKAWLAYSTNDDKPFAMAFQNYYDDTLLSKAKDKYAFLPVTVESGDVKVTILESDLRSYPGMFLKAESNHLKAAFAKYPKKMAYYKWRGMSYVEETEDYIAKSTGARTYPWRVMAITEKDTEMPVSNLVFALATPNQIGDTSWIRPGKVAWDWWNDWNLKGVDFEAGINTRTYQYYIDFAAKNGIPYIVLDEGWYDSSKGDIMNPIPEIDLQGLIDYGRQKGVSIVLWTVFNVLDEHLTAACDK